MVGVPRRNLKGTLAPSNKSDTEHSSQSKHTQIGNGPTKDVVAPNYWLLAAEQEADEFPLSGKHEASITKDFVAAPSLLSILAAAGVADEYEAAHFPLGGQHDADQSNTRAQPNMILTDEDKRRMCQYAEDHPGVKQTEIGNLFGVPRSMVSKVLRNGEKYLGSSPSVKKTGRKLPDVEPALGNWARMAQRSSLVLPPESPATVGLPSPPSGFELYSFEDPDTDSNLSCIAYLSLLDADVVMTEPLCTGRKGDATGSTPGRDSPAVPNGTSQEPLALKGNGFVAGGRTSPSPDGNLERIPDRQEVEPIYESPYPSDTDDAYSTDSSSNGTSQDSNRDHFEGGRILSPVLDSSARSIVDRLMVEFHALWDQGSPFTSCEGSSEPRDSPPTDPGTQTWPGQSARRESGGRSKRMLSPSEDQGNSDDVPDDGEPNKRLKRTASTVDRALKFACPYYKRDPLGITSGRSCTGPGWDTVHRVKEHLYRRHSLPIRCSRCYETFRTVPELDVHLREAQVCDIREGPLVAGFSKEQERQLRSRRKTGMDEPEKWREVYRILFPDDDEALMPSPYHVSNQAATLETIRSEEVLRMERFSRRELPRLVREELERQVLGSMSPVENQLRSQLVDIVRDCQALVFRHYNHQAVSEAGDASRMASGDASAFLVAPLVSSQAGADISAFSLPPPPTEASLLPVSVVSHLRNLDSSAQSNPSVVDSGYASTSDRSQRNAHESMPSLSAGYGCASSSHSGQLEGHNVSTGFFDGLSYLCWDPNDPFSEDPAALPDFFGLGL